MKLYHGTSLDRAIKIKKHGFDPSFARHDTKILEKIEEYIHQLPGYSSLKSRIAQRIGCMEAFKDQISFVGHFDVARIWAKGIPFSSEMKEGICNLYKFAIQELPEFHQEQWYQQLKNDFEKMQQEPSSPVVITANIPENLVKRVGMTFYVPKNNIRLHSLEEYCDPESQTHSNQDPFELAKFHGYYDFVSQREFIINNLQAFVDPLSNAVPEYRTFQHIPAKYVSKITSVRNI